MLPWTLAQPFLLKRTTNTDQAETRKMSTLEKELARFDFEIDYDGETQLFEEECRDFMNGFVRDIFAADQYMSQQDKARFGLLCQHGEGREAFARAIDPQRIDNKEVDEFTFYRLVQYVSVCLFECNIADDFKPATMIMNMCFTFYYTSLMVSGRFGQASKQYIYEYLTEQPIWKSSRFWNAAFLFAIHIDRVNRPDGLSAWTNTMDLAQSKDYEVCETNSAFGHLASFLYMMKSLGVTREDRTAFKEKMSVLSNLRADQVRELEESCEILQ